MSRSKLKKILLTVIPASVVLFSLPSILFFMFGTFNPFYSVTGTFLRGINAFDIIVINSRVHINELKIGDIIVYRTLLPLKSTGYSDVFVQRVVAIYHSPPANPVWIVTKSDRSYKIAVGVDYPVVEQNYIGKEMYVIPRIGVLAKIASPPYNYILLGVIVLVLFLVLRTKQKEIH
jgi:signal peptidase I